MSIAIIGLDTAKSVFQVHGLDETRKPILKKKLQRSQMVPFFEKLERCTIYLEACGAGHHWARILIGLGHDVNLIAPEKVTPFVKKGKKNDPADAAALCEAGVRPDMKFVPVKPWSSRPYWLCIRSGRFWSSSRRCCQTRCAAWRQNSA